MLHDRAKSFDSTLEILRGGHTLELLLYMSFTEELATGSHTIHEGI